MSHSQPRSLFLAAVSWSPFHCIIEYKARATEPGRVQDLRRRASTVRTAPRGRSRDSPPAAEENHHEDPSSSQYLLLVVVVPGKLNRNCNVAEATSAQPALPRTMGAASSPSVESTATATFPFAAIMF